MCGFCCELLVPKTRGIFLCGEFKRDIKILVVLCTIVFPVHVMAQGQANCTREHQGERTPVMCATRPRNDFLKYGVPIGLVLIGVAVAILISAKLWKDASWCCQRGTRFQRRMARLAQAHQLAEQIGRRRRRHGHRSRRKGRHTFLNLIAWSKKTNGIAAPLNNILHKVSEFIVYLRGAKLKAKCVIVEMPGPLHETYFALGQRIKKRIPILPTWLSAMRERKSAASETSSSVLWEPQTSLTTELDSVSSIFCSSSGNTNYSASHSRSSWATTMISPRGSSSHSLSLSSPISSQRSSTSFHAHALESNTSGREGNDSNPNKDLLPQKFKQHYLRLPPAAGKISLRRPRDRAVAADGGRGGSESSGRGGGGRMTRGHGASSGGRVGGDEGGGERGCSGREGSSGSGNSRSVSGGGSGMRDGDGTSNALSTSYLYSYSYQGEPSG